METNNKNQVPDIQQTVVLNAPIQKVWAIVSTAEGIASWFMENDFEPKAGHEFHIQSPFGPSRARSSRSRSRTGCPSHGIRMAGSSRFC